MTEPGIYEARAFHPGADGGPISGRISIGGGALRFDAGAEGEARGIGIALALDDLKVELGGAADRLVFFSSTAAPGWSIFTDDRSVLRDSRLRTHPRLSTVIGAIHRRRVGAWAVIGLVAGLAVAAVVGLIALKDPLVRLVANQVPASVEVRLGAAAMTQIGIGKKFIVDEEIRNGVVAMTAPLLRVVPTDRTPFEFHVVEDSSVNAFALPGGQVVIHSGLLLAAESPGEVSGVLAHEIAHVTERHGVRQLIGTLGLFAIVQSLVGDVGGVIAVIGDGGAQLLSLRFSRDFEREADDTGWTYLTSAQLDPKGLVTFFRRLEAEEAKGAAGAVSTALSFLNTHPATAERIERLEKKLARETSPKPSADPTFEFRAFQDRLRRQLQDTPNEKQGGAE